MKTYRFSEIHRLLDAYGEYRFRRVVVERYKPFDQTAKFQLGQAREVLLQMVPDFPIESPFETLRSRFETGAKI
jgi:hypothetical protein